VRTLALGIGSSLRGDDAVGPLAAEALAAEGLPARAVTQLLPEHALELAEVERVLFLDASREAPPGAVTLQRVGPVEPRPRVSHRLDPRSLLALCVALHGRAPEGLVLALGAAQLEPGAGLSGPVATAWEAYLARARALLAGAPADGDPAAEGTAAEGARPG